MDGIKMNRGVCVRGITTPYINIGIGLEELKNKVFQSVMEETKGDISEKAVVAITEAVVAMAQNNIVPAQAVADEIDRLFPCGDEIVVIDPIFSRNRFVDVLVAIAKAKTKNKVKVILTCPSDEVGNALVDEDKLDDIDFDYANNILTEEQFVNLFGRPEHMFTGVDYIKLYRDSIEALGKVAEIYICSKYAFRKLPERLSCDNFLVASIHRRNQTRKMLLKGGAKTVHDLTEVLAEKLPEYPGYNPEYGCLGTNAMGDGNFKLFPRDCNQFVLDVQKKFMDEIGVHIEVMVYGDGAFKDPAGGIWELADPVVSPGYTPGLKGQPSEIKLKKVRAENPDATDEEIARIIEQLLKERRNSKNKSIESALGTTPRNITDLLGSLADLSSGSGHRGTPVVLVENYFEVEEK